MTKVYAIENLANGMAYVGCTSCKLNRRFNEHMSLLRKRKHTSSKMTDDFGRCGRDGFAMRVLEVLPDEASVDVKRDAELRWMRSFEANGALYNEFIISFEPGPGFKARTQSPEARMKRSLAQLGKPKGHGAKISATKKALGQRPSPEAIRRGNIAGLRARWGNTDEIVSSASKTEDAGSKG